MAYLNFTNVCDRTDMQAYLGTHEIADEIRYFDPVKTQYGR